MAKVDSTPVTNVPLRVVGGLSEPDWAERRCALVVAHPGHELVVHSWLSEARPRVLVLTDGSGHGTIGRIGSTARVVDDADANRGGLFGDHTDHELYAALLAHDSDFFLRTTDRIAAELLDRNIDFVAGDAVEGYNPVHDVCRMMTNAAVRMVRERGRIIDNFDFFLVRSHETVVDEPGAIVRRLDDREYERKLAVSRAYSELRGEVEQALGERPFAVEGFRPADRDNHLASVFYDTYGRQRVRDGFYSVAVTYDAHVRPIEAMLARLAARP
jgi:hypothetical protein